MSMQVMAAESAPKMNIHNAKPSEVLGSWDLVTIKALDPNEKKFSKPYQRWTFNLNGVMRHIASTATITDADMTMNAGLPPTIKYSVENGVIHIVYTQPPMTVTMGCYLVDKIFAGQRKGAAEKEGDMILAAYRKSSDEPDIMWILRRSAEK